MPSKSRGRGRILAALMAAAALACRDKAADSNGRGGGGDAGEPGQEPASSGAGADGAPDEAFAGEGGMRFRDAAPKVEVDADGPVDPACTGTDIALAVAVTDRRCAIGSARAKQLRAALERDGGKLPLRQEARTVGDRVELRLVNAGSVPLTLPLSFHAKLPAFTALAEDAHHALYELESPRFEVPPAEGGGAGQDAGAVRERPHFARVVLEPGASARATVVVSPVVVRRLDRDAGLACEGGVCAPARLAKGTYELHVGELLTDVEAGPPARVTWQLP